EVPWWLISVALHHRPLVALPAGTRPWMSGSGLAFASQWARGTASTGGAGGRFTGGLARRAARAVAGAGQAVAGGHLPDGGRDEQQRYRRDEDGARETCTHRTVVFHDRSCDKPLTVR